MTTAPTIRYQAPGWATRHLMNPAIRLLIRLGVGAWGARELRVVGRRSGQVRQTVVNLLDLDGQRYLVAPRGTTQWVRNLRAAGRGELSVGRRVEHVAAAEVADQDKVPVLRAYLERWRWEAGQFFDGVDASASDAELAAIAAAHPVFAVVEAR